MAPRAIAPPEIIDMNSPLTLDTRVTTGAVEKTLKIKRSVTVEATIDADSASRGEYKDFQLERVIP
jgi:hypothetical protein